MVHHNGTCGPVNLALYSDQWSMIVALSGHTRGLEICHLSVHAPVHTVIKNCRRYYYRLSLHDSNNTRIDRHCSYWTQPASPLMVWIVETIRWSTCQAPMKSRQLNWINKATNGGDDDGDAQHRMCVHCVTEIKDEDWGSCTDRTGHSIMPCESWCT